MLHPGFRISTGEVDFRTSAYGNRSGTLPGNEGIAEAKDV